MKTFVDSRLTTPSLLVLKASWNSGMYVQYVRSDRLDLGEQEEADQHHFQRMRLVAGQLDVLGGQVVLPWDVGVGRCIIPGEKHTLELLKSKSNLKKYSYANV